MAKSKSQNVSVNAGAFYSKQTVRESTRKNNLTPDEAFGLQSASNPRKRKAAKVLLPSSQIPKKANTSEDGNDFSDDDTFNYTSIENTPEVVVPKRSASSNKATPKGGNNKYNKLLRKIQNNKESTDERIRLLEATVETMSEQIAELERRLENDEIQNKKDEPIPAELQARVHAFIESKIVESERTQENHNWNLELRFDRGENIGFATNMVKEISNVDNNSETLIRTACRRYFNHLKRQKKKRETMTEAQLQSESSTNRCTSRRTKAFQRRRTVGLEMELNGEKQALLGHLKGELMTDEESEVDDDGEKTGRLVVRKLLWRSQKLDDLILEIDAHKPLKAVKPRVFGEPSEREPPADVNELCVIVLPLLAEE
ncbi:uncharacterized protein C14orf93-like [Clytia hemisphaerica]|uniref:Uncharacterized protein n=1 Tax=Clytia hemisphaerica TaxID=252671 RepID=A0A7M5X1F0_9CNID